MLGFSPISTFPISTIGESSFIVSVKMPLEVIGTIRTVVEDIDMPIETLLTIVNNEKIPVEIIGEITTIVEDIDIPIEILSEKTIPVALKWVLTSRDNSWTVTLKSGKWTLEARDTKWELSPTTAKWILDPNNTKWTIK
tara:strand:+ start:636 stop:1052 length:417 start_codon:yes stop_codon:yes gene_type:complete